MQLLGGEFRRLMPSDITQPGAFARNSVPITRDSSKDYATDAKTRNYLNKLLVRDGCHTCGACVSA